jgi:Tol biopolymer transport system component
MFRRGLAPLLTSLAALLVLAPAAGATLTYQTGVVRTTVWVANDDGSGAHKLAAGRNPAISPNGQAVAYGNRFDDRAKPVLRLIPTAGGTPRTILKNWRYGPFAWSPDSRWIATQAGPEVGRQRLVLIDVATGAVRTVASGYFSGASFSPDSTQLVYGRARTDRLFTPTNIEVAAVAGGAARRLTTDGHSQFPVWGPRQIAYTRWNRATGKHRKEDGPKYHLWLMNPDGSARRQLTKGRVPFLLSGLTPTAWSADGTRLLAQFGGQDTTYPVAVDPATGRQRHIGPTTENGIDATGFSRDGTTILGTNPAFDDDPSVATVPWTGGRTTVIVRHASAPTWNR